MGQLISKEENGIYPQEVLKEEVCNLCCSRLGIRVLDKIKTRL